MDKKVGIITYHAAYNFGSALQAFATYKFVELLGYHAQIINYRPEQQRQFYSLHRKKWGLKTYLNDVLMYKYDGDRRKSHDRFEQFMINYMKLTCEFSAPQHFSDVASAFDICVSGSDQIWNKNSCELAGNSMSYMMPYVTSFVQ